MRDSWGQNFRTKDGRKVALTDCSTSSETPAQWTDVRAATDCEVPARMKTLTRWRIWFWVNRTSPEVTAQSVKYHRRQVFLGHQSALYENIYSWGDACKSWLRQANCTACKLWRSLPSLSRTLSSLRMKNCTPWRQQWKNCENQLRFHRVKANKMKHVF